MRSTAEATVLILALALAAGAAPRKTVPGPAPAEERLATGRPGGKAAGKAPKPAIRPAAPETVYVQVTPPRESAPPAPQAPAARRQESGSGRQEGGSALSLDRDWAQAYGAFAGFYSAEVLGSNPFGTVYWDLYPRGQSWFFEFTAGGGTAQSGFSRAVIGADQFENNWLASLEALAGWTYARGSRDPWRSGGHHPYFVAGMTALWQGGVPNVGAVLGFGNRMAAPWGAGRWAINYGVRDHIYSQKIRNEPSLTQNFVLLIGTQKYF